MDVDHAALLPRKRVLTDDSDNTTPPASSCDSDSVEPPLKKRRIASADDDHPQANPTGPPRRVQPPSLPQGWYDVESFSAPLSPGVNILVSKTPISKRWQEPLSIPPKDKFSPNYLWVIQKKGCSREVQFVVDLTHGRFYNGRGLNKVDYFHLPVSHPPTKTELVTFVTKVKSFLTTNPDFWVVVHDGIGYNDAGMMCCAYLLDLMGDGVDVETAAQIFATARPPGIFSAMHMRKLHEYFSTEEELQFFEEHLSEKPLPLPPWEADSQIRLKRSLSVREKDPSGQFFVPQAKSKRSRSRSRSQSRSESDTEGSTFSPGARSSPLAPRRKLSVKTIPRRPKKRAAAAPQGNVGASDPFMMSPAVAPGSPPLSPTTPRPKSPAPIPLDLHHLHSYLQKVSGDDLQRLTQKSLELASNGNLFKSITEDPVKLPCSQITKMAASHCLTWRPKCFRFWMLILNEGCYLVDPLYVVNGTLGGVYGIPRLVFHNRNTNQNVDSTLIAGELVVDTAQQNGSTQKIPRFLITDVLCFERTLVKDFSHGKRLNTARVELIDSSRQLLQSSILRIRLKPFYDISDERVGKMMKMLKQITHETMGLQLVDKQRPFGASRSLWVTHASLQEMGFS